MGEQLIGPSSSNLKGHFENINFVIMNDKILESLNSFGLRLLHDQVSFLTNFLKIKFVLFLVIK